MSAQLVEDFFPHLVAVVQQQVPWVYTNIFPDWSRGQCPELQFELHSPLALTQAVTLRTLRNPSLLPHQLIGTITGLWAARRLWGRPGGALWALALLFYAAMCISSVACHVMLPRGTAAWRAAVAVDVALTGLSASTMAAAAAAPWLLCQRLRRQGSRWLLPGWHAPQDESSVDVILAAQQPALPLQQEEHGQSSMMMVVPPLPPLMSSGVSRAWAAAYAAAASPVVLAAALVGNSVGVPFTNEVIYLVPVAAAAVVLTAQLAPRWREPGYIPWFAPAAVAGAAVAGAAVAIDRALCATLGPVHTMVQFFFLGCNTAALGVARFLLEQRQQQQEPEEEARGSGGLPPPACTAHQAAGIPARKPHFSPLGERLLISPRPKAE